MKTVGLEDLVLFLNRQTQSSFKGPRVDAYLAQYQVDLAELTPFCRFREDTYARNLIHRTNLYELFLLAWLPGHRAGIHDHAGQRCWMTVSAGELTFQNYKPIHPEQEDAVPTPNGLPSRFSAGDGVYIDDGVGLHSIINTGKTPAITLHLYAGPISHCRVYDEKLQSFRQVELICFPPPMEWNPERPKDLV